jgi:hypothetical protein
MCTIDYTSLEALMRDAERVESGKGNRFNPSQQNNCPFWPGPVAMELNATAAVQKLTPEEREKCLREGLCLRCREKGHRATWHESAQKRKAELVRPPKTPRLVPAIGPSPPDTVATSHILNTSLSSAFETPHLGLLVAKGFINSHP